MLDGALPLGRTGQRALAAQRHFSFQAHDGRTADGALPGSGNGQGFWWTGFEAHGDDLRNDIPGAPHHHPIADAHVLALQFVHVVEGRVADGDPAHEDRLQLGHWCQGAASSHREPYVAHDGICLLGCKLVGNGPAWCSRDGTEYTLLIEIIHLVDHAVHGKG